MPFLNTEVKLALEQTLTIAVAPALKLSDPERLAYVARHLLARLAGAPPPPAPHGKSAPVADRRTALLGLKRAIAVALSEASRQGESVQHPLQLVANGLLRQSTVVSTSRLTRDSFSGALAILPPGAMAAGPTLEGVPELLLPGRITPDKTIDERTCVSVKLQNGMLLDSRSSCLDMTATGNAVAESDLEVACGSSLVTIQIANPLDSSEAQSSVKEVTPSPQRGISFAPAERVVLDPLTKSAERTPTEPATETKPAEAAIATQLFEERTSRYEAYTSPASIFGAVRTREVILLRASWVLARAGYVFEGNKGWVIRKDPDPLPTRAEIEEKGSGLTDAIMTVEELEDGCAIRQTSRSQNAPPTFSRRRNHQPRVAFEPTGTPAFSRSLPTPLASTQSSRAWTK